MKHWIKITVAWLGIMALGVTNTALALEARLTELTVTDSAKYIALSTTLELAFEGKIKETIHGGIDTTFVFRVELLRERAFWFDETIISREIIHTVKYDTLSQQYTLHIGDVNDEQSLVTTDFNQVKKWLTRLEGIKVIPVNDIKAEESYYIRVMAEMEALEMPFPLEYIPFMAFFQEFETPWAIYPLSPTKAK